MSDRASGNGRSGSPVRFPIISQWAHRARSTSGPLAMPGGSVHFTPFGRPNPEGASLLESAPARKPACRRLDGLFGEIAMRPIRLLLAALVALVPFAASSAL